MTQFLALVDAMPAIGAKPRPQVSKPKAVQGDRGYDPKPGRNALKARGMEPKLAKRREAHGSGLRKTCRPVERTLS